jgi:hypothetical protein
MCWNLNCEWKGLKEKVEGMKWKCVQECVNFNFEQNCVQSNAEVCALVKIEIYLIKGFP